MANGNGSGWSSPTVALTIISLLMAAVGSYLAIQRDDSRETRRQFELVRGELNDHNRRMTVLETKQGIMWERQERRGE